MPDQERVSHLAALAMVMAGALAFALAVFLYNHDWSSEPAQPPWEIATLEQGTEHSDMYEAVFRYEFEHNASGGQSNVDYYFLALGEKDPSPEFLARFGNHSPAVEPASTARTSAEDGVSHEEHGGRGLVFDVTRFRRIDDDTVEVESRYYEAGLSAAGNIYRVERRRGEWFVTERTLLWES